MPRYKYQHFVPRGYLKHFSIDGRNARRESLVWRLNGDQSELVPVQSECAADWHNTVEDAAKVERMFGVLENNYSRIANRIWSNNGLSEKQKLRLLVMMFELHCRNPAYENLMGKANIQAYEALTHCLRILIGGNGASISDTQHRKQLQAAWRVGLLHTSCEPGLITSDNPALWFTFDDAQDTQRLHFMLLPVTPFCCAVAWDNRLVRVTRGDLREKDQIRLNHNQLQHCTNFIYGSSEPSPDEVAFCRNEWARREPPVGEVTLSYCVINFLKLKEGTEFSVLSRV